LEESAGDPFNRLEQPWWGIEDPRRCTVRMNAEVESMQVFTVTITWSPEAEGRLTEGDLQEAIEQLALEIDEEAVVDVAEGFEQH